MSIEHPSPKRGSENLVKVLFPLNESDWHGYSGESMWAKHLRDDKYQLRNVPFHTYGASYDDVVIASPIQGRLTVQQVSERNGHSTYRIFLSDKIRGVSDRRFQKFWAPLETLGCKYEGATERLLAVDVPPEADIHGVYELLNQGELARVWEFEEGHCGHPLANAQPRPGH